MNVRRQVITLLGGLAVVLAFAAAGCKDEFRPNPPAAPRGVYSITGDRQVDIYWTANGESNLKGYNVYWAPGSSQGQGVFKFLGFTTSTHYVDTDVQNGTTYYYAVSAVNRNGEESGLSAENVHDTPRPEGYALNVYNAYFDSARGGPYVSSNGIRFTDAGAVLTDWYTDTRTDVFYYGAPGHPFLYTEDDSTFLEDMGQSHSLVDVDFAPRDGWSQEVKLALTEGHTYCVWTRANHFAKLFVRSVTDSRIVVDWAYQVAPGNLELKPVRPAGAAFRQRPEQPRRAS